MALNIDTSTNLTPDVYGINAYVNEIKKQFTPDVSEDTLMLGIFGYSGQMFSDLLQNSIVMASEFSNESIPTRAKFEKNIIAHALGLGITDIDAVPAQFDVLLTFVEDDISSWYNSRKSKSNIDGSWTFIFDRNTPIYIGDFCFHVDYDIEIKKIKLQNSGSENKYAYTARYLMGNEDNPDNPISNITNPYLTSPVSMKVNGINIIFTKCTLHQVERKTIYKTVLSDNSIASKIVSFSFEGQLAAFDIDVTEGNTTTHLIPVYDGLSVEDTKYPYFYYSYMDANTIRIKFDRTSYAPRINSEVKINLQLTSGESGNFTFDPNIYPGFSFESERFGYSNIGCEIRPITGESAYGSDKKSIDKLKSLIPKEATSRGSITNFTDLQNFFNMIDTDDSKLYFYKKRDNALERLYYSYIVMRDQLNTIVPTNTIDIKVYPESLRSESGSNKLIFGKDLAIRLIGDNKGEVVHISEIEGSNHPDAFYYTIPYNFAISTDPLYGIYYLNCMDTKKFLDFSYINDQCVYQFISTSISWTRNYSTDPDTYSLNIALEQNVDDGFGVIHTDDDGNTIVDIRCIAVMYDEEDNPHRWAEGVLRSHDSNANIFYFEFKFTSEDYIDTRNKIKIDTGLYDLGTNNESYAHLQGNTKCVIHVLSKQNNVVNDDAFKSLGRIVPNIEDFTLSNSYTVVDGLDFFYDYSEIVSSTVVIDTKLVDQEDGTKTAVFDGYTIKQVPVVKYNYFSDDDTAIYFFKELVKRKNYIDYAIQILEDSFGMDFKFFNTYGPSRLFTLDETDTPRYLNSTSVTLSFKLKLKKNYDTNIINDIVQDIKAYVEDINEINSLHMPNLVTDITSKYQESIVYFEFIDMNGYGPGVQHLYALTMPDEVITPEFLNIASMPDGTPSILINMV